MRERSRTVRHTWLPTAASYRLSLQQLMAYLAACQIANDLAALRAALCLTSNLELGSWTMDHNRIPDPFGLAEQRIGVASGTLSPELALNQSTSTSASLSRGLQPRFAGELSNQNLTKSRRHGAGSGSLTCENRQKQCNSCLHLKMSCLLFLTATIDTKHIFLKYCTGFARVPLDDQRRPLRMDCRDCQDRGIRYVPWPLRFSRHQETRGRHLA